MSANVSKSTLCLWNLPTDKQKLSKEGETAKSSANRGLVLGVVAVVAAVALVTLAILIRAGFFNDLSSFFSNNIGDGFTTTLVIGGTALGSVIGTLGILAIKNNAHQLCKDLDAKIWSKESKIWLA